MEKCVFFFIVPDNRHFKRWDYRLPTLIVRILVSHFDVFYIYAIILSFSGVTEVEAQLEQCACQDQAVPQCAREDGWHILWSA